MNPDIIHSHPHNGSFVDWVKKAGDTLLHNRKFRESTSTTHTPLNSMNSSMIRNREFLTKEGEEEKDEEGENENRIKPPIEKEAIQLNEKMLHDEMLFDESDWALSENLFYGLELGLIHELSSFTPPHPHSSSSSSSSFSTPSPETISSFTPSDSSKAMSSSLPSTSQHTIPMDIQLSHLMDPFPPPLLTEILQNLIQKYLLPPLPPTSISKTPIFHTSTVTSSHVWSRLFYNLIEGIILGPFWKKQLKKNENITSSKVLLWNQLRSLLKPIEYYWMMTIREAWMLYHIRHAILQTHHTFITSHEYGLNEDPTNHHHESFGKKSILVVVGKSHVHSLAQLFQQHLAHESISSKDDLWNKMEEYKKYLIQQKKWIESKGKNIQITAISARQFSQSTLSYIS